MDRVKEAIQKAFNGKEEKYKDIFAIIDRRWDCQLHYPLHAAGYFLNPELFYSNPSTEMDCEVLKDDIHNELPIYKRVGGMFGYPAAVRKRTTMALRCEHNWNTFEHVIDDSNELIVGELVFDDDVLTWRDVARATRAAEPLKYTRRQTQIQRTVVAFTSKKEKGKEVVEEEDEDESSQDEGEEEYNFNCNGSDEYNDMELEEDEED
ncbi:hypothetical protein CR513_12677, partial [Mucuna pruriens]